VAKWLHLSVRVSVRKKSSLDSELANRVKSILVEVEVAPDSACANKSIIDMHIPQGVVISMIHRNNSYIIPEGKTQFKQGDRVSIMADSIDSLNAFYKNAGLKGGT
jgi:cell volume regulation protein A